MKEHFLNYEQSLAVKELGFDEPCLSYYEGESFSHHLVMIKSDDDYITAAPLKSQFFKWVREKHDIDYSILPESSSGHKLIDRTFNVIIYRYIMNVNVQAEILRIDNKNIARYISREQAEDACINKIIELLKLK